MSVVNTTLRAGPFAGDGSTVNFDIDFKVLSTSDLYVAKKNISTLVVTELELGTHYTVVIDEDEGATLTMLTAPSINEKLYIYSNAEETQELEIEPDGELPEEDLETAYDKLTILVKQVTEKVGRALKFPMTSDSINIDPFLPEPDAGKALVWNDDEDGFENSEDNINDIINTATALAAASSASAAAAALSETAASNSEDAAAASEANAAASELAAAASALEAATTVASGLPMVTQTVTQNTTGNNITGVVISPAASDCVRFLCRVKRGTTVFGVLEFHVHYFDSAWDIVVGNYTTKDGRTFSHGLTFGMTGNQLTVDVNNGAGNADLIIKKDTFNI